MCALQWEEINAYAYAYAYAYAKVMYAAEVIDVQGAFQPKPNCLIIYQVFHV